MMKQLIVKLMELTLQGPFLHGSLRGPGYGPSNVLTWSDGFVRSADFYLG